MKKRWSALEETGYVIVNTYGTVWARQVFPTVDDARAHLRAYFPDKTDFTGWHIALGRATYSVMSDGKPITPMELHEV